MTAGTFPSPPQTVIVADREIPIETDFRASVAFEQLAADPDAAPEDVALAMLDLYFPQYAGRFTAVTTEDEPELVHLALHAEETVESLLAFYGGGLSVPKSGSGKGKRLYDFTYDEAHIYASFLQAYQIDLREAKLHWWNFKALFCALPHDTVFGRMLHIRSVEISPKMSKDEKAYYKKLKKLYALPDKKSEREQREDEELRAVLEGSGDLSELGW